MKKLLALGAAALAVAACGKSLPENPKPTAHIVANFDPGANPPVVPAPNDLAFNPATGTLNVPSGASDADAEFAAYLNTLNGFPADAQGATTFSGALDPSTVTGATVKVFSWDGTTLTPVTDATPTYVDVTSTPGVGGLVNVLPPAAGWGTGKTYVVAVLGYGSGVSGAKKEEVIASPAFALIRSQGPLAVCDQNGQNCRATTDLIPSTVRDPAGRVADQGATAGQLEQLRLHYKPFFDALSAQGVDRGQVAQLWSFAIASNVVTPEFLLNPADPCATKIPTPNDLAIQNGHVNAPTGCAGMTDSENEFIADYLNKLDGFPTSAAANETFVGGKLKGSTVTLSDSSVLVVDLTDAATDGGSGDTGVDHTCTGATDTGCLAYDATSNALTIVPPAAGWPKGHEIAAALLGGIQGSNGEKLVASDVFALVRSSSPLVDCDLTDPTTDPSTCHSTLTLAPLTNDQAVQLEMLRLGLKPAIDALGIDRGQLAMFWTFKVYDNPEATFTLSTDASQVTIPFPFNGRSVVGLGDALQLYVPGADGGPGHIHVPVYADGGGFPFGAALNTLDGFSTTAPILSAFGPTARDLTDGANVDPASINPADPDAGTVNVTVGLVNLGGGDAPDYRACVNCGRASDLLVDGGEAAEPEQLAIIPNVPLNEQTDYGAFITNGLMDTQGRSVVPTSTFALLRMKNPIVDFNTQKVLIPEIQGIAPFQVLAVLEFARQAYQPFFDQLDAANHARGDLALAWDFHTQTTYSSLVALHQAAGALDANGFPTDAKYVYDASSTFLGDGGAIPAQLQTGIGSVALASVPSPFLLVKSDGGYGPFNLSNPVPQQIPLIIYEPSGTPPTNGWPVALFGHGITRWRGDSAALASAVNQAGIAMVAFDEAFHGDRSVCVGAAPVLQAPSDDAACKAPSGTATCDEDGSSPTYGRCVGTTQGLCSGTLTELGTAAAGGDLVAGAMLPPPTGYGLPGDIACQANGQGDCVAQTGHCEGATFKTDASGKPLISGWDFIDLTSLPNYFWLATRDHFRQDVVDEAQLEQVLTATGSGSLQAQLQAAGLAKLDESKLSYVGQSLGGILGTSATSASPDIHNAVLNVPGGELTQLMLTSPGLSSLRDPLLGQLHLAGVDPGTFNFDTFINFSQWVLDPADPVNSANHLTGPVAPADRKVLVQWIDDDEVVPNFTTAALIASANRASPEVTVTEYSPSAADWPIGGAGGAPGRHGFLLDGFTGAENEACYTIKAQTEAATWLSSGAQPSNWTSPVNSCP